MAARAVNLLRRKCGKCRARNVSETTKTIGGPQSERTEMHKMHIRMGLQLVKDSER